MERKIIPLDMTPEQIEQHYRDVWSESIGNFRVEVQANLLAVEMNRRLVEATNRRNRFLTILSLGVSFFALVFASTSAVFSYIDWQADSEWQKSQIQLLKNINEQLIINSKTIKIIDAKKKK